jgi:hypothetical protein
METTAMPVRNYLGELLRKQEAQKPIEHRSTGFWLDSLRAF